MINRLSIILLAIWCLLTWSATAHAFPVVGAIVGAIGLSGAVATIATYAITGALLVGGMLLSSALTPDTPEVAQPGGVEADVQLGSNVPHRLPFGQIATKGHYVYFNEYDDGKRLDQVYVLGTGWCNRLKKVMASGEECPLTEIDSGTGWTKYAVELPDDGDSPNLWVTFWEGRHDQPASPALIDHANAPDRWTSDHIGTGICYAHVEARYDRDISELQSLLSGNTLLFVIEGLRLYDPRLDSTAGGDGPHRFDDWRTWEYSDNPAVGLYHYERGYFINGMRVGGVGRPGYRLITEQYMAAANVCDEEVELADGGSEPRYRHSVVASEDIEHIDAITAMAGAMAADRVEMPGLFGVIAGAAQVPVATFTDDDILLDAPKTFSAKRGKEDLYNRVYGQFSDPANNYEASAIAPVIGNDDVVAVDGGHVRTAKSDFLQVNSGTQAERLNRIKYRQNRRQASARHSFDETMIHLTMGDWLVWQSAKHGTRTFKIIRLARDLEKCRITVDLQETHTDVYGHSTGEETPIGPVPVPPSADQRPRNVRNLRLQATAITGPNGQTRPAINVFWDTVTDETITAVVLDHQVKDQPSTAIRSLHPRPLSGEDWSGTTLVSGIQAGQTYEVRSTINTAVPRRTEWSDWVSIQTSGQYVVQSAQSLYLNAVEWVTAAEINASLSEATDAADAAQEVAGEALETANTAKDNVQTLTGNVAQAAANAATALTDSQTAATAAANAVSAAGEAKAQAETAAADATAAASQSAATAQSQTESVMREVINRIDAARDRQVITGDAALANQALVRRLDEGREASASYTLDLVSQLDEQTASTFQSFDVRVTATEQGVETVASAVRTVDTKTDDNAASITTLEQST
ncbi:hypothetical protein, partial [Roseibium sp. RKSG952]|uniref:hypothetical protein n=1 Tax=Roseibium sp. RKSG952 TaxID=2529384 RepID=UPI0012BC6EC7